jgi:hypothetical protein
MSPTRLTGYVTVPRDAEFVTLIPGDDLPDWAKDIVTNPDVLEVYGEATQPARSETAGTTAQPAQPAPAPAPDRAAVVDRAKALEVKANGKTKDILARIAAKEAEIAAAAAAESGASGDSGDLDIAALRTKANELGLEFTDETSESELELLIQTKE